ncbi:MAG: T9SS type A sorting domain-containing protein [Spirosomataceae bacterium]
MKKIVLFLSTLLSFLVTNPLSAQDFSEDFNFSGALTANSWTAHSAGGTSAQTTSATGLSMTGLNGSGNAVVLNTSGEDVSKSLGTSYSSGSVYLSFLVNVSAAKTAGDYFIHLIQGTTSSGTFYPRIFVKSVTDGIQFGISKTSTAAATIAYTSKTYSLNTTYLVVVRYTFNTGSTTDDTAELFVNNSFTSNTEPSKSDWLAAIDTPTDATSLGMIALRQGNATNAANLTLDRIRVGATWTSIASLASQPVLSVNNVTVPNTNLGTASNSAKIEVIASDLTAPISVAFSTSNANFEFSLDNGVTWGTGSTMDKKGGTVLVRSSAKAILGDNGATITFTSGSLTASSTIKGTVFPVGTGLCGITSPINKIRAAIPSQNTYTGTAVTLAGRVASKFGTNKFYLQDNTGGIAIFSASGSTLFDGIVVGDSVQVTGATARFNGEAEILNPTCINKVAGTSVAPKAVVFDASKVVAGNNLPTFLENNEGKLIQLTGVNFLASGTFATGNYSISACNNLGDGEIRIDATATTIIGSSIPTVSQAITGVVGHYINTSATVDILQVFPNALGDLAKSTFSCSIPVITPAASCGTLAGTEISADSTLDVTTWNAEWLGNTTTSPSALGPIDDAQQMTNVIAVLSNLKSDVFCLEEICDHTQFIARVAKDLPNYGVKCQTEFYSHSVDAPEKANDATTYSQKVCFVYNKAVVTPIDAECKSLLAGKYSYPTVNNWASGRLPYLFVANAVLNGKSKKIHFVGLHAKSGSALTDYNRRKQDVLDLKTELDANYATANIIMLGDYNDDLDTSIAVGNASSYAPFVKDTKNYNPISKALSMCGVSSTASYPDIIDHLLVSNEFGTITIDKAKPAASTSGMYYLDNTINVARPINYVANYVNSTSDHYPVSSRFYFGFLPEKILASTKEEDAFYRIFPNPATDYVTIQLKTTVKRNANVTLYNAFGQAVIQQGITQETTQIPTSNLPKGVYIIHIKNEQEEGSFKMIKE